MAELAAVAAIIRGEVIDDATITKLHALNQTIQKDTAELSAAVDTVPK